MIGGVLFDAAGTLIELCEPVGETYARVAAVHGVHLPGSRLEEAFGRSFAAAPPMAFPGRSAAECVGLERAWWREVVRGTFRAADGSARFADFDAFFAALWELFALGSTWRLREGAGSALRVLERRKLRLGVVSNFDQRLHSLLQELGIAACFEAVVLPADAGRAKPDPAIFAYALARLGLPAGDVIYVGDDVESDTSGAHSAGLRAIEVSGLATLTALPHALDALEPG